MGQNLPKLMVNLVEYIILYIDELECNYSKLIEIRLWDNLTGAWALVAPVWICHCLTVPQDVVYAVMYDADSEALKRCAPQFKKKKEKVIFTSRGPNFVHSLDIIYNVILPCVFIARSI